MKSHQPADGSAPPSAELHLDALDGGRWTWRYVEPGVGMELHSNETYPNRESAVDWARRAYPDVPFADDDESESAPAAEGSE